MEINQLTNLLQRTDLCSSELSSSENAPVRAGSKDTVFSFKDLPDELINAARLGEMLQEDSFKNVIASSLQDNASLYGIENNQIGLDSIMHAIVYAEPFIQKLGDVPTEIGVNEALERGAKIELLKLRFIKKKGMKSFPAVLKAISLEGELPMDSPEAEPEAEHIIRP